MHGPKDIFFTHICAQEEGQPQVSIELQTCDYESDALYRCTKFNRGAKIILLQVQYCFVIHQFKCVYLVFCKHFFVGFAAAFFYFIFYLFFFYCNA